MNLLVLLFFTSLTVVYLHDKSFFSAVRSIPSDAAIDDQFNQHKNPLKMRTIEKLVLKIILSNSLDHENRLKM